MTMNDQIKLAIFDCDGTLVDSQHSIVAAMNAAFDAHGFGRPPAFAVRRVVGLPLIMAIAKLLPDVGHQVHESLTRAYKDAFAKSRGLGQVMDPLYPGAALALAAAANEGWLLGVATGKSRRGLDNTLEQHGLIERFVTLQTSDIGQGKPHPDMLLRALAETGVEALNAVMIGDTAFDMEMAKSAQVVAIGVTWGYHEREELRASGARILIDEFGQLPKALASLMEN